MSGKDEPGRSLTIGSVALAVCVLAASVALTVDRRGEPATPPPTEGGAEVLPSAPPVVVVVSAVPSTISGRAIEATTSVYAEAPVDTVQLWSGNRMIGEQPGADGGADLAWSWLAGVGDHVVVARAVRDEVVVGESAPVWIEVVDPVQAMTTAAGPPPSGTLPPDPDAPMGESGDAVVDGWLAYPRWTDHLSVADCLVSLTPSDDLGGPLQLNMAWPGTGRFVPVLEVDHPGTASLAVPGGPAAAYLSGPDGSGPLEQLDLPAECTTELWTGEVELAGGLLTVDGDAEEAYLYLSVDGGPAVRVPEADHSFVPGGPEGFDFGDVLPHVTGRQLTVSAWGRRDGALVHLGDGVLDIGDEAGAAGTAALPSDAALDAVIAAALRTDLDWVVERHRPAGNCELCFERPELLARHGTLADDGSHIGVAAELALTGIGASLLEFRFEAHDPTVTHVVWQVSAGPLPVAPLLDFPGLLASQVVPSASGEFSFDIDELWYGGGTVLAAEGLGDLTVGAFMPDLLGGSAVTDDAGTTPLGTADDTTVPASPSPASSSSLFVDRDLLAALPAFSPSTVQVRAVPFSGPVPLPEPSNPVVFAVDPAEGFTLAPPPPELTPITVESIDVTFFPPRQPNSAFGRCVRVVANPHGSANPSLLPQAQWAFDKFVPAGPGDTVCAFYAPPSESWFDSVVGSINFVAALWDGAVSLLKDLKDGLVELAAQFGCKQWAQAHWAVLPQAAKDELAKQGIHGPLDLCVKMIGTAVDAYLAVHGIPPSMPTSAEVAEGLKGDLAALVADQVAELCPDLATQQCQEQAEKIVGELIERVQGEISQSAVNAATSGDWALFLNPDIVVVPEPAGQFQPAMFKVAVELAQPAPTDRTCEFLGRVQGTHPSWTYIEPQTASSSSVVTKLLRGPVMVPATGSVFIPQGATQAVGVITLPTLDRSWHPTPADHWNSDPFWWAWFEPTASMEMILTGGCTASTEPSITRTADFGPIMAPASPEDVQLP